MCIPCMMTQAFNTARKVAKDEATIRRILNETAAYVQTLDLDMTPAEASNRAYEIVSEITGIADPYAVEKKESNDFLLARIDQLRETCLASDDPLKASIRLSIMGNIIDYGVSRRHDIDASLATVFTDEFDVDDYAAFRSEAEKRANTILILGDNAGEIVMDTLLAEQLLHMGQHVMYVVKKGPIINDATHEDAAYVGIDRLVPVIDTGSNCVGINWKRVSDEFMNYYHKADIVISKGQANYETMSGKEEKPVLYLLKAKCELVAEDAGVRLGGIVCKFKR